MIHDPSALETFARALLVGMFPFSAVDKLMHRDTAMKQAASSFLPGAPVLLLAAVALELAAPLCVVADWHAGMAAALLAAFCIITALLYHPFWKKGDFWVNGDSVDRAHFWDFTKNLGLAGGLILVVINSGLAPLG